MNYLITLSAFLCLCTQLGCDPAAQCGNTDETTVALAFSDDGVTATFATAAIADEKETLSSDEWKTWRIHGSIKTPVTDSDGNTELVNQRVFSMSAPFATAIPATFRVGTVPEGWESGLHSFTTSGPPGVWPEGALTPGDEVRVGLEALTDVEASPTRCTLAGSNRIVVPGTVGAPCVDVPSDEDNLNYPHGDTGTYTQQRNLCEGFTHQYAINVAVGCTLTANVAYDGTGTDILLEVLQANGNQLLSTSSESASPESTTAATQGGSLFVKLRLVAGDAAKYTLDVVYTCN